MTYIEQFEQFEYMAEEYTASTMQELRTIFPNIIIEYQDVSRRFFEIRIGNRVIKCGCWIEPTDYNGMQGIAYGIDDYKEEWIELTSPNLDKLTNFIRGICDQNAK